MKVKVDPLDIPMRLDKRVSKSLEISRSEARKIIKRGQITLNAEKCRDIGLLVKTSDQLVFDQKSLESPRKRYIMLHKPSGFECTAKSSANPSALDLLKTVNLEGLHFAGRLDLDTTGLVLISDDGQWTHRITAPSKKQPKCYQATLSNALTKQQKIKIEQGVLLKDSEKLTKPATVIQMPDLKVAITLYEGRYHQVKRMFAAVGNHVQLLHRHSIGEIVLDELLKEGQWRYLSSAEVTFFG